MGLGRVLMKARSPVCCTTVDLTVPVWGLARIVPMIVPPVAALRPHAALHAASTSSALEMAIVPGVR